MSAARNPRGMALCYSSSTRPIHRRVQRAPGWPRALPRVFQVGGLQTLRSGAGVFQGPPMVADSRARPAWVPASGSQRSQGQRCLPSVLAAAVEGHPLQCLQEQVSTIPRGPWGTFEPSSPKDLSMHLMRVGAKTPQQMSALGLPCWRDPYRSGTRWQGAAPPGGGGALGQQAHCNLSQPEELQFGRGPLSSPPPPGPVPTVVIRHKKMGLNPGASAPNSSPISHRSLISST